MAGFNFPLNVLNKDLEKATARNNRAIEGYLSFQWYDVASRNMFQNSWENYGSPYASAQYMKDPFGFVHLQGLVRNGTDNSVIFTLPVEYRPADRATHVFGTIGGNTSAARVDVQADGDVSPTGSTAPAWIVLDGISFYAG